MVDGPDFRTASAVVPVYNGAATLERCLASLVAQSPALKEVLVIDDGSSDGSWDIIEAFARREPRLVVQRHRPNAGLSRTLNEAIGRATGDAILLLHQDAELLGSDWVDRGLAVLRDRPRTCLSGRPLYPFAELSAVETAFGVLRDTFFDSGEPAEALGFSEFKCDLLPRDVLQEERFDEGFRASGEDQVLSTRLAERGYTILRLGSLAYQQRFGNLGRVRSQLRKEVAYGRTEGGILLRTNLRVAKESSRSATSSRRLANRATAILVPVALLSAAFLALLTRNPWFAALPLALLAPRIVLVVQRGIALPRNARARARAALLAVALIPVNDLLYGIALIFGLVGFAALRRV